MDIDRFFQQYGWTATRTGEGRWRTTFTGDLAIFTVNLHLTADWLIFTIDLSSYGWSGSPDQASRLLAANAQMLMAKFAIGPHSRLLLQIEMPTEAFTYSHFADCLGALAHYADVFCREWRQT